MRAVEIGRAESATWQQSSSGPFASESNYVYSSRAQQAAVWRAVVGPKLVRCAAQDLVNGSGGGVRFRVTRKQVLGVAGLPAPAAHYRVSGTATSSGQSIDVFLDTIVLGHGRAIGVLSVSSFEAPVPASLDRRLAQAAARRLSAG